MTTLSSFFVVVARDGIENLRHASLILIHCRDDAASGRQIPGSNVHVPLPLVTFHWTTFRHLSCLFESCVYGVELLVENSFSPRFLKKQVATSEHVSLISIISESLNVGLSFFYPSIPIA